jgi:anti-repressor protein
MNALTSPTPFQFEGRNVRLVEQDGETWFVAADVARELGYGLATDLTKHLDADEKGMYAVHTLGGEQQVTIISEAGVYRAIVQRKLNKKQHDHSLFEKVSRFQRFVFHDVLPSIRKTGTYNAAPAFDPSTILSNPAAMRGLLLSYTEKVIALESANAEMKDDVAALDRIAKADGSLNVTEAAKVLQVRPKNLFSYLSAHGWIYRRAGADHWLGYQSRVQSGDLEHKVTTVLRADGSEKVTEQVRVTAQGLTKLAKLFPPSLAAAA